MNKLKREDETFNKMFKSLDIEIIPPEGTKEKIFKTLSYKSNQMNFYYSLCHSWLLARFIKLTIPLSILLTIFIRVEAN